MLCTKLNTIQRDIDSAFHESVHLRENIIRACRDHSALAIDMINSISDTFELVNNLYASIVNYESVHKSIKQSDYMQSYKNEGEEKKTYFVDRQYRRDEFISRDTYDSSRDTYTSQDRYENRGSETRETTYRDSS
jgi:hypothetical protein